MNDVFLFFFFVFAIVGMFSLIWTFGKLMTKNHPTKLDEILIGVIFVVIAIPAILAAILD